MATGAGCAINPDGCFNTPDPRGKSDYTFYPDGDDQEIASLIRRKLTEDPNSKTYSIDCSDRINWPGKSGDELIGRIVACRCFRGEKWSVTVRLPHAPPRTSVADVGKQSSPPEDFPHSNFTASDERKTGWICSPATTCNLLMSQMCLTSIRRGLIVITGATASGKSTVTRGLVHLIMRQAVADAKGKRRPHLITFEDPIEELYKDVGLDLKELATGLSDPTSGRKRDFDYTPRERGFDAPDLRSVFRDALRQTPALVFVGEIRDIAEWKHVIDFVGTGHSVIATAHAGSLAESWGKILSAVRAQTPAQRSDVADRVLGIVHLRPLPNTQLSSSGSEVRGALPAVWRYTISGAKSMMAEGRGSLVPLRGLPDGGYSSFGRVWFIEELIKSSRSFPADLDKERIRTAAFQSDLEGI